MAATNPLFDKRLMRGNRRQRRAFQKQLHQKSQSSSAVAYMHGGRTDAAIHEWIETAKAFLNQEIEVFNAQVETLQADALFDVSDISATLEHAESQMQPASNQAVSRLPFLLEQAHDAEKSVLAFQVEHGISRPPVKVDKPQNAAVLITTTTLEGAANSLFFLAGGIVAGFTEALGYGLSIAAVSTVLSGVVGGNVFGRYWNFGKHTARADSPDVKAKRIFARMGAVGTGVAVLGLLVCAAIVRTTGDPANLSFNLETLSRVFADYQSYLLLATGAAFAVLNWRTGLSLMGDPVPGYDEAAKTSITALDGVSDLRDDALDDIEDIYQDAKADLEDIAADWDEDKDEREDLRQNLRVLRHALVTDIKDFTDALRARLSKENAVAGILGGQKSVPDTLPNHLASNLLSQVFAVPEADTAAETSKESEAREALQSALMLLNDTYKSAVSAVHQAAKPPQLPPEDWDEVPL